MAETIYINQGKAEEDAKRIEGAAAYLANVPLVPQDTRTTLPANTKSKEAYGRSQNRLSDLGALLDREVKNIRGLNVAFTQFDEMTGRLARDTSRYPVIRNCQ